ncbi:ATP-binding protein [Streptomyces sp. NPDC048419]|jgi:anti-sigma regulatory factor (Ser/Thr protein kinase)|uniref:ATP-binding protein n=1 Tax=Streptomyces sp. NPDC048419 TaxID=3365547 RepID=UPI003718128A
MAAVVEPGSAGEDGIVPGDRAMQFTVALVGDGTCIARARHLAADFLHHAQTTHGVAISQRALDLTQLVVSELVTNACKYAPGPLLMDLRIADGTVEIVVWDSDPALPLARTADAGRVGQHGLEIVMAIAQGFEAHKEPVGKRISARIALTDGPDGDAAGHRPG